MATFTPEERAAMRERIKEEKRIASVDEALSAQLRIISTMDAVDRELAEKIHKLVQKNAPDLVAKTWYGMPAYQREGKTVLFFQAAGKFKTRYATLGFQHDANLDDGNMWATSFALLKIDSKVEKELVELIRRAASVK